MAQYGCQKCGSTGSVMEMRIAVVTIGQNKELQASGIVPVQRCLNDKCGAISAYSNLDIGALAGVIPTPVEPAEQLANAVQIIEDATEFIEGKSDEQPAADTAAEA